LAEVLSVLDQWFDPSWAESWDAVGLVCGDPDAPIERVLLAVDPVPEVVAEAERAGAQLLVTHHPLLLSGVHGVPTTDPKGALVHRMIRSGVAHLVAHTNADVADPGVSDALAGLFGLTGTRPVDVRGEPGVDKLVVFVPVADAQRLLDALAAAGAGRIGDYDRAAWWTEGTGTFRPLPGANPAIGSVGDIETVPEIRLETVVPRSRRDAVITALRATHPYEEPAFDLLVQAPLPTRRGAGRVGDLPEPVTLRAFTERAAAVLPATRWGVRAAGDPERIVRTVAVSGGSGASYTELARRAGADVFLASDFKHHQVSEAVAERGGDGMALVDAAHWATEAPWLDALAGRLRDRFGTKLEVLVSRRVTDPWTLHAASPGPVPITSQESSQESSPNSQ